ncbi:hypothetical protein E4U53_005762 [Claviceps sorghi]|nr:hypothetical protein E4U53_005762 [Claviceps sorghi]
MLFCSILLAAAAVAPALAAPTGRAVLPHVPREESNIKQRGPPISFDGAFKNPDVHGPPTFSSPPLHRPPRHRREASDIEEREASPRRGHPEDDENPKGRAHIW